MTEFATEVRHYCRNPKCRSKLVKWHDKPPSWTGRVLYRHRIIEDDHHAVSSVAFERAVVLDDDFAMAAW